ncbi:small secreted protein [Rutstroemia sp. NJR-2017a WRK4]|nr:small secreted protein [Rutstroemia sp. NJR-2017a WRK4]
MGVPFEALLPYGIMLAMFGITGAGLSKIRHMQNGGKRARHSVDAWDRIYSKVIPTNAAKLFNADLKTVMDRDRRLTGYLRGQTDNPSAPLGFELNNPWRVRLAIPIIILKSRAREENYLSFLVPMCTYLANS